MTEQQISGKIKELREEYKSLGNDDVAKKKVLEIRGKLLKRALLIKTDGKAISLYT